MKKGTKALLLVLCAVMLVAASVLGTLAYLTSTDNVTNTFTVGKVGITLDEAEVNLDGKPVKVEDEKDVEVEDLKEATRVQKNEYHLLPGHEYTKDPTVHIQPDSEEAYYRMIVTVSFNKDITDWEGKSLEDIIIGYEEDNWKRTGYTPGEDGKSIKYEFRYKEKVSNSEETAKDLEPLFTGIKVPADLTNEQLADFADMKIEVVAHAIQADGFEDTDAAWEAFEEQRP